MQEVKKKTATKNRHARRQKPKGPKGPNVTQTYSLMGKFSSEFHFSYLAEKDPARRAVLKTLFRKGQHYHDQLKNKGVLSEFKTSIVDGEQLFMPCVNLPKKQAAAAAAS